MISASTLTGSSCLCTQLRPGMKGTATITTRTTVTPVTVTEVKNGTVMQSSGSTIIVRTDEGVRAFSQGEVDKRGLKIMRDGKPAQLSDFRQGDRLSATIITSMPPRIITEKEVEATLAATVAAGDAPPAAAVPAPSAPAAAALAPSPPAAAAPASSAPAATTAPAAQAPTATAAATEGLPNSAWLLLGLAMVLLLAVGLAVFFRRRFVR